MGHRGYYEYLCATLRVIEYDAKIKSTECKICFNGRILYSNTKLYMQRLNASLLNSSRQYLKLNG